MLGAWRLYAAPNLQLGLAYNGYTIIAVDTACAGLNTWLHVSTGRIGRTCLGQSSPGGSVLEKEKIEEVLIPKSKCHRLGGGSRGSENKTTV